MNGDSPLISESGVFAPLRLNLRALGHSPFLLPGLAVGAGIVLLRLWRGWRPGGAGVWPVWLPIALLPLLWYEVFRNHSTIHYWFTYRWLAFSLCLAGLATLSALTPPVRVTPSRS